MKRPITLQTFLDKHRPTVLATVQKREHSMRDFTDQELKAWVRKDKDLKLWAQQGGVAFLK